MPSFPHIADTPLHGADTPVSGAFASLGGERFYRIASYDRMDPFFMSVVSASNHWMFISSTGGLTAGRGNADHALFPYYAVDRLHDDATHTGSRTVLRVDRDGTSRLWEPLRLELPRVYRVTRNLYKHPRGDVLVFEEVNHDLSLVFRYRWCLSPRFGFVKRAEVENRGDSPARVELLDGLQNLLPSGVEEAFQVRFSVLGDAYKQAELHPDDGVATFALSSVPGDSAEPMEALRATVCWSTAAADRPRLLSSRQVDAFRQGHEVRNETRVLGRRGAYFVRETLELGPGASYEHLLVADLDHGISRVVALRKQLAESPDRRALVLDDVAQGSRRLTALVARGDGLQKTGDRTGSVHHFANVLFNSMRGGTFAAGYTIPVDDLKAFIRSFNRETYARHRDFLDGLEDEVGLHDLKEAAAGRDDPDLLRLVEEYLPLSFSRRHGDPSRPWNRFAIRVRDRDGALLLGYEGNWRDIFQNWEALCLSFPEYLEGMIGKFVNTTTADGYNPYRVTNEGFDWEEPAPDEPWANLGYWGDHQIVYLLKFLEWSRAHHPDGLNDLLAERRFVYAEVPYDLRPYAELLEDPRHSIHYSTEREARIAARVEATGFDGRYLVTPEGDLCRATLTEKLLVPLLAKVANLVPGAGFWMNTQRPEWNDANNALAGYGASMVTLYYARRYVTFFLELLEDALAGEVELSVEVAEWLEGSLAVLDEHRSALAGDDVDDGRRKAILDGLGTLAGNYRAGLYQDGLTGRTHPLPRDTVLAFLRTTRTYLDHAIARNRREDGLYHAYNVLEIQQDRIGIHRLYPMLEGQVAALSSGALEPAEAERVMAALRKSEMYREDQHSYMLYPNRVLPGFLEKNVIPAEAAASSRLFAALVADDNRELVEEDVEGTLHFNPDFRNVGHLDAALERLREEGYRELVDAEADRIREIYEDVFDHRSFTGRSGTFYGYEGLGSIYWHMVSKLLLAVQEVALEAHTAADDAFPALAEWYYDVRSGIGFNKSPDVYGAFPTDPYSHTPFGGGAKQPGMTGQVKEEVITRLAELGVRISGGRVRFEPALLRECEFLDEATTFEFYHVDGEPGSLELEAGTLGFTYCQVPVVYRRVGDGETPEVRLHLADGTVQEVEGLELDAAWSGELFRRTGRVRRMDVVVRPGLES